MNKNKLDKGKIRRVEDLRFHGGTNDDTRLVRKKSKQKIKEDKGVRYKAFG